MRARQAVRDLLAGSAITVIATIACFALFVLVQALSYWTPKQTIEQHLRTAFERGELDLAYSRPYDSTRGYHQRNDCLILWMTVIRPESLGEYLAAGQFVSDPAARATYCETLRDHLVDDPTTSYEVENYLRYLHGYRPVTAFALSVLDVPDMRLLFKGLCYALLTLTAVVGLRRMLFPRAGAGDLEHLRASAGIGLSAVFALFYGLEYFGQSPSHAPAAWSLFLFMLAATSLDLLDLRRRWFFLLTSAFGAFIAFFEYLTGAAIIGLALLLGTMGLQGRAGTGAGPLVWRSMLGVCSYLGAIVLSFTLNLFLNVWVFGSQNLIHFFEALATRMGSTALAKAERGMAEGAVQVTSLDVLQALVEKLDFLTAGHPIAAQLLYVAFVFAILGFAVVGFMNSRSMEHVVRVLLVLASAAVIVLWFLAFKNHGLLHAAFMVRVLVWLPAAAVLMSILVFGHLWSFSRTETGLPDAMPSDAMPSTVRA